LAWTGFVHRQSKAVHRSSKALEGKRKAVKRWRKALEGKGKALEASSKAVQRWTGVLSAPAQVQIVGFGWVGAVAGIPGLGTRIG
jgi:hypothetical protein